MRITKKELLARTADSFDQLKGFTSKGIWENAVVAAAKALSYEVVEEPELPERLQLGTRHDDGVDSPRALRDAATQPNDDPRRWAIARNDRMAAELVLRYNAKVAVLKVVKRIENAVAVWENQLPHAPGVAKDLREYARLFRAAYEVGDE